MTRSIIVIQMKKIVQRVILLLILCFQLQLHRYDNKQDIFVEEYMYITIERNQIQHITEHILHFRIFLSI